MNGPQRPDKTRVKHLRPPVTLAAATLFVPRKIFRHFPLTRKSGKTSLLKECLSVSLIYRDHWRPEIRATVKLFRFLRRLQEKKPRDVLPCPGQARPMAKKISAPLDNSENIS
jgi:hypothetical protein